jgi:hypothetical protein
MRRLIKDLIIGWLVVTLIVLAILGGLVALGVKEAHRIGAVERRAQAVEVERSERP